MSIIYCSRKKCVTPKGSIPNRILFPPHPHNQSMIASVMIMTASATMQSEQRPGPGKVQSTHSGLAFFPRNPAQPEKNSRRAKIKSSWPGLGLASHTSKQPSSSASPMATRDVNFHKGDTSSRGSGIGVLYALPFAIPGLVATKFLMTLRHCFL